MKFTETRRFNAIYLTVLPFYRQSCVHSLLQQAADPCKSMQAPDN